MEDKLKENKLLYVGQKAIIDRDGEVLIVEDPAIGLDFPGRQAQRWGKLI